MIKNLVQNKFLSKKIEKTTCIVHKSNIVESVLQKMIYLRDPISYITEYRLYPKADYLRRRVYKPQSLYCDYYYPIRSLFWNSSYWPLYRTVRSFENDVPAGKGLRLQKVSKDSERFCVVSFQENLYLLFLSISKIFF